MHVIGKLYKSLEQESNLPFLLLKKFKRKNICSLCNFCFGDIEIIEWLLYGKRSESDQSVVTCMCSYSDPNFVWSLCNHDMIYVEEVMNYYPI